VCSSDLEGEVEKACKDAITHLDIPAVKSGTYTVICNPEVAAVFAHEAFGHTCEGDKYKNEAMKKELATGRAIASKILNIYDTGLDEGCRGYLKYDDEGVKTEKTYLIKKGIFTGKLHSRETSALLHELPTGSARAINYKFPPICRMRNTCIENGEIAFEEMIKGIDKGLYVVKARGGTGGEMFTITPRFSFMIRKGEITGPVKGVKITGNLFETLKNIDMVGSDFQIISEAGGCGKNGQMPLPISHSAPHIRIQNVSVGGEI